MNPYGILIEAGAVLLCTVIAFGSGYHFGGMASKTALEADRAAQLQAVVNQLDENARAATADHARLQGVIDTYDAIKDSPDLAYAAAGTAHRLYIRAAGGGCDVPETPAVASGAQAPAAVTLGPSGVERALGDYIAACSADAAQMIPMVELAP